MKYARLSSVFVKLMKLCLEQGSTEGRLDKFSSILSYISDNALEKITIDDICRKTHISKYHLCRKFKEATGQTVVAFLNEKRLAAARQLLVTSNQSVLDIAASCGFECANHFNGLFKKKYGLTPYRYKQRKKADSQ